MGTRGMHEHQLDQKVHVTTLCSRKPGVMVCIFSIARLEIERVSYLNRQSI